MTRVLQLLFGCVVSGVAVYLLATRISLGAVADLLAQAAPVPLVGVVILVLVSVAARAARWQVYFLPHDRVPIAPLISTLAIGYMASTFLPFRAGELIRALFLARRESLALPRVVGTIVLEKLFDFLVIGLLLAAIVVTNSLPESLDGTARNLILGAATSISGVIIVGFGLVVAFATWRNQTVRLVHAFALLLPSIVRRFIPLDRLASDFAHSLDSLRSWRLWWWLLTWSAAAWACSMASAYLAGLAIGLPLGLAAVAFLTVVTSTGQAVPSSPGYIGVFQAAAVLALAVFGVDAAAALSLALLLWAVSYGTLVVAGMVALWVGRYRPSDLLVGLHSGARELAARPNGMPRADVPHPAARP